MKEQTYNEKYHNSQAFNIEYIKMYDTTHFLKEYEEDKRNYFDIWKRQILDEITNIIDYTSPLFQGINLINQYNTLNNQKKYYKNILNNINNYTYSSDKQLNVEGYILNLPYWFKNDEKHLLMIKPGCSYIDINNIPNIPNNKKTKEKYGLNLFEKSYSYNTFNLINYNDRSPIIITIPKSLDLSEIKKLIMYIKEEYNTINYVCEDIDIYVKVKTILVDSYLEEYKELQEKNKTRNSFICIDPNYYDEYFKTNPNVKIYYHMYDYTSDYKFKKKHIMSIEDLCNIYINRESEKIDYDKIKEAILGSYSNLNHKNDNFDEYKYASLNYYFRIPELNYNNELDTRNKKIKYNKKSLIEDFYNIFGKNNEELKSILNEIEYNNEYHINNLFEKNIFLVIKEEDGYRKLFIDEDEVENMYKLGQIDNINVALCIKEKVIIWKNFPYVPMYKEEISNENAKTYTNIPNRKPRLDSNKVLF